MKDEEKSREQLMGELETMRRVTAQLEAKVADMEAREKERSRVWVERSLRVGLRTNIEFAASFQRVQARGINLSEGGICFELDESMPFRMKFEVRGKRHEHNARLIWAKRLQKGGYRFGFKFGES